MGEAQTPHFYDFGIFEPVTKPQNQLCLSLETPGHLNKIKKDPHFQKHIFLQISEFRNSVFRHFPKRRAPTNDEDPYKTISKFLHMGPISPWKHGMIFGSI